MSNEVGRLAMRIEGDFWVAYYAMPNTMEDAIALGTVRLSFVESKKRKDMFLQLMKDAVSDLIEKSTGVRPTWPNGTRAAPEHERTKT